MIGVGQSYLNNVIGQNVMQDLRGALGVPGGKDSGGVRAIRDRFLPRFAARLEGLPPIALNLASLVDRYSGVRLIVASVEKATLLPNW